MAGLHGCLEGVVCYVGGPWVQCTHAFAHQPGPRTAHVRESLSRADNFWLPGSWGFMITKASVCTYEKIERRNAHILQGGTCMHCKAFWYTVEVQLRAGGAGKATPAHTCRRLGSRCVLSSYAVHLYTRYIRREVKGRCRGPQRKRTGDEVRRLCKRHHNR